MINRKFIKVIDLVVQLHLSQFGNDIFGMQILMWHMMMLKQFFETRISLITELCLKCSPSILMLQVLLNHTPQKNSLKQGLQWDRDSCLLNILNHA